MLNRSRSNDLQAPFYECVSEFGLVCEGFEEICTGSCSVIQPTSFQIQSKYDKPASTRTVGFIT